MEKSILINEIFPDPVGADRGYEWLEIVNISSNEIDLSSWKIEAGGIKYSRIFTFPSGSKIPSGEYILVCENFVENCNYYTSLLGMQNGRGKTDGVRILNNSENVVNTVLYSKPNVNELKNDFGDVEIDENIILMPPEGYSIARKNFSSSGFSSQDFFSTNTPTPGQKNIFSGTKTVILSEISLDYIEFYTPLPPENINEWYIVTEIGKQYLSNEFKNSFFVIDLQQEVNDVKLYSPDGNLVDSFFVKRLSKNYSYCRAESEPAQEYVPCDFTKGSNNTVKENWEYKKIIEVEEINIEDQYIVKPCVLYKYGDLSIISDNTMAKAVECENCQENECYIAELDYKKENVSKLYVIDMVEKENIAIEKINLENYLNLFNKVVHIEGVLLQQGTPYSYLNTEIGLVKILGKYTLENEYVVQGILKRESDILFELQYPIVVENKHGQDINMLENTGSPYFLQTLFFLTLFFAFLAIFLIIRKKFLKLL